MTDTETGGAPATAASFDVSAYLAQEAARTTKAEELRPVNKAALFGALATVGIVTVVVTFDGYGDSGQIELIDARDAHGDVALPDGEIELVFPTYDGSDVDRRTLAVRNAIEELSYAFLEQAHDGWEINEGAYGEFVFDVAEHAIRLDYNERIESSEHSGHEW